MDVHSAPAGSTLRTRLRAVVTALEVAPIHLVGLLVLTSAACAGLVLLWWTARPVVDGHPATPPAVPSALPSVMPSAPGVASQMAAGNVVVHVSGAVTAPGVHQLPAGSRVHDAVAAAGGATPDAVTAQLNLARPLRDGEQIHLPDAAATAASGATVGGAASGSTASGATASLNLNRATASQLEELPGVGPVLAQRIVDHREAHGTFTNVEQLRDVTGIGERTFAALAPLVTV